MSVQTILLDFSIEPDRIGDDCARKTLLKQIKEILEKYFPQLKFAYDILTDDGYLVMYTETNGLTITVRFFHQGLIILNIEYYKIDCEPQRISFEVRIFKFIKMYYLKENLIYFINKILKFSKSFKCSKSFSTSFL